VTNLTRALVAEDLTTEDIGACVAQGWIDGVGLETMVEAGFFDEEMNYVDPPMESITPQMQRVLTTVITDCSLSGLTP
jgi:hypothetical protein